MLRYILASVLLVSFASCKKDDKKEDSPKAEPKPATDPADTEPKADEPKTDEPSAAVIVIKAAKLTIDVGENNPDGPQSLSIDDDGNVMADDTKVAKLNADGSFEDLEGKRLGSVDADGVVSLEGEDETIQIAADGAVTAEGKVVSTIKDGILTMEDMSEKVQYEGPEEAKRAMMVVFLLAMMPSEESSDSGAAEVEAVPAQVPAPSKK